MTQADGGNEMGVGWSVAAKVNKSASQTRDYSVLSRPFAKNAKRPGTQLLAQDDN